MLGLAIRIQEIVIMTPGMMIRPRVIVPMIRPAGVFVRSTVQARKVPQTNEQSVVAAAK